MSFVTEESGAVTIDWVVLTAGIAGLGMAVAASVNTGTDTATESILCALGPSEAEARLECPLPEPTAFFPGDQTFGVGRGTALRDFELEDEFIISMDMRLDSLSFNTRFMDVIFAPGPGQLSSDRILLHSGGDTNDIVVNYFSNYGQEGMERTQYRIPDALVVGEDANFGVALDDQNTLHVLKDGEVIGQTTLERFTDERTVPWLLTGSSSGSPAIDGDVNNVAIGTF